MSNNVSAVNLLNIKRIGRRTNNLQWFKVPAKTYFEPNAIRYLKDMKGISRVTIVTDHTMTRIGFVDQILDVLSRRSNDVMIQVSTTSSPSRASAPCTGALRSCGSSSPTRSSRSAVALPWTPRR